MQERHFLPSSALRPLTRALLRGLVLLAVTIAISAGSAYASCGCVCTEDADCHDGAV